MRRWGIRGLNLVGRDHASVHRLFPVEEDPAFAFAERFVSARLSGNFKRGFRGTSGPTDEFQHVIVVVDGVLDVTDVRDV